MLVENCLPPVGYKAAADRAAVAAAADLYMK